MEQNIFLCDKKWNIEKILQCSSKYKIAKGVCLADLVANPFGLLDNEDFEAQKQSMVMLRFQETEDEIPVIVCTFSKYYLVFIVRIENEQDFSEFTGCYMQCLAWADEHLQMPYNDEYYEIQLMNNQLINSQRALTKSNMQLKKVLNEVREANNTISLLEHDNLTGLYCASAFYRNAQICMKEHSNIAYDIIVLDIDNFKLINEIFGRKTGDVMLQKLAMYLTGLEHVEQGLLARASADTFYILMPQELHFYEILDQKVADFLNTYPLPVHVQAKIGVFSVQAPYHSTADSGASAYPSEHIRQISVEQMCDQACLALNTLNPAGDSRIAFYDHGLHEKLVKNHQILDSVPNALKNHEFQLYLQTKVDMTTGDAVGAEALIRWIHPELGFIPPNQFIPLLEEQNYVYDVDKYIWEEACKILKLRKDKGLRTLPISVNVARGDLYEDDLADVLQNLIHTYQLNPEDLHLEILERAYVDDSSNIFHVLSDLRNKGFFIEMDDFGTGASSLAMVAQMPVNLLKLDRQFLVSGLSDKRHVEVIRFIINLAKTLDIGIIAEGVENQVHADFLLSMGCRFAQGFYYCRPQPAEFFLDVP